MPVVRSPIVSLRAKGALAVFTQPAFKAERVTYPVITPSAARGLLEAVLWKPAMRWRVQRIDVLAPIEFVAFRRNEVSSRAAAPSVDVVRLGGHVPPFFADEDRAQRNTVALRDVDYAVHAAIELTEHAGPGDNLAKFVEMFRRRVERGQHFHQPYLGCREFPADIVPADSAPPPVNDSRDLGIMLWDVAYAPGGNRARFFRARLERGVLHVPEDPEATLVEEGAA